LAFKATDASGATSTTFLTETVNLVAVNDPPTLTTTAISPGFTEAAGVAAQASAVALFSNTDFNLVEAGQNVKSLTFTVSGLADGANETVVVDGTSITLGANITNSPSTATQAML